MFAAFPYLDRARTYPEKQVSEPWVNSIPPSDGVLKFEAGNEVAILRSKIAFRKGSL